MAVMLLSGLSMGAVFDGYRVVSNELKLPRWWLPALDILYWIASAVLVFRMLYASNNGEVRAYVFLGLAIGVILHYWLFSKAVIVITKWLIRAVQAFIRFIIRLIDAIIVKPILLLYKLAKVIIGFGSAFTIFTLKIVIQLVRPIWLLLRWMTKPIWRPLGRWLKPYWDKLRPGERIIRLVTRIRGFWQSWFRKGDR